jgi:integrase
VSKAPRSQKARAKSDKDTSWNDAVDSFIRALDHLKRSRHTQSHYRDDLRFFSTWWKEVSPAETLTPETITDYDLESWERHLGSDPLDEAGRTRKPAAINAKMAAVKSFLRWAHKTRLIPTMPEMPDTRKLGKRSVKSLEPEQQHQLIRRAARDRNKRSRETIVIMIETGVRVAELVAWRWDVDIKASERAGTWEVKEGKGCKPRGPFPMSPECCKAFRNLRKLAPDAKPGDRIFTSQRREKSGERKPLTVRGVQELLSRYAAELGWERLYPHQLRHSFAFNKRRLKVDWPVLRDLMGHSSVTTTMDSYGTPGDREFAAAMNANQVEDFDDEDE